jgi:excisionase family DNA binding protein
VRQSKQRKSSKSNHPVSNPTEPRLLTIAAAASYLSATIWFVRTLAWSKAVPHLRLGKRILFDRADLDRYIDQAKQQQAVSA